MTGLLVWLAWTTAASPLAMLVHELGHAAVALRLTRGPVLVRLDGRAPAHLCFGRLYVELALPGFGGVCMHDEIPGRYEHAKVAAAGPLASLAAGLAATAAWRATGWLPVGAFAVASFVTAVFSALPHRRRARGVWEVSDGLVVLRSLGLVRPPKPRAAPTGPIVGVPAAVLLMLAGLVTVVVAPWYLLLLVPIFAVAWRSDVRDRERAVAEATPQPREPWDTQRSKAPPGER